jgi:alpha-L-fucosidase
MKKTYAYLFVVLFIAMLFSTQKATAQYTIPTKMKWWYESRFGMFIHFGSYSYLAQGEWAMSGNYTKTTYQTQVSKNFNPAKFNAGTIARLAKNAGMKYLVITSKHHEGFCMWPTAVKSFKSIDATKLYDLREYTPFDKTRDILKELKDSCDAVGVKFCLYYSILDWNHPSQTISRGTSANNWYTYSTLNSDTSKATYIRDMKLQLKELIDNYHPAVLWFDGDWTYQYGDYIYGSTAADKWWTKADGLDLQNYLRGLDPNLLMNERVFRGVGYGDWDCSEGSILATANSRPWETCQTMNNSWGYNSSDHSYKTTKALVLELVQNVSRDGNYLLNIGPKGDGTVPSESVVKLDSVGKWMNIYSSSIYGATRSPFSSEPAWGLYTKKSGKLYAQVFVWPTNGLLKVPSVTNAINKIYLLNDTTSLLSYKDSLGYIRISVPAKAPNSVGSVVVIDVAGLPTASTKYTKVTAISVAGQGGLATIQGIGSTLQMLATVTPTTATDKTRTWAVSDTTIATISSSGLLTAKKVGSVTVTATAKDGSDIFGQAKITVVSVSAISNPTSSSLKVYPNPTNNGIVKLKYDDSSYLTSYSIVDMLGKEELKGTFMNQITLDIRSCKQGTYFVTVKNDGKSEVQKLLVN